jgi:hypothetical protein
LFARASVLKSRGGTGALSLPVPRPSRRLPSGRVQRAYLWRSEVGWALRLCPHRPPRLSPRATLPEGSPREGGDGRDAAFRSPLRSRYRRR